MQNKKRWMLKGNWFRNMIKVGDVLSVEELELKYNSLKEEEISGHGQIE